MHKLRFLWVAAAVALIGSIALVRWGWVSPEVSDANCRLSKNGAWISVDWTSKPVDESAVRKLAEDAAARRIRYIFPYATYLRPDGTFNPTYEHAAEFVATFRHFNDQALLLAWIGIPLKSDSPLGVKGWVDLTDRATRSKIVAFSAELMKEGH